MIPFADLKREYNLIKNEIDSAIAEVFERGIFILGDHVSGFEKEFARYCGLNFGVGVANGTDAIKIALLACGIKQGDEVITVPNTAVPTVSAIVSAGARPVFVDIEEDSYLMDTSKLEKAVTKKTRAVVPVHLYGQIADMDAISSIAAKYGLKVIEDCAQSAGAELNGKKAGSFSDASAFSFYPTKNLGAYGDGGMVLTQDGQTARTAKLIRTYGFEDKYLSVIEGFNSRLDELHASILRVKLKYLDEFNQLRIRMAGIYNTAIANKNIIKPAVKPNRKHVFHLYIIRTVKRDSLAGYLKGNGVSTLIHYPVPVHLQKSYQYLGYKKGDFPVAERIADEILSLPLFIGLTDDEILNIAGLINKF